jgi:PAS domain S-box-containing protein
MARVGSVECDIATDLVLASDEIYEMFELPRDESITFEQLVNRIADEGRERVSEAFRRHVAGRETGMLLIQCNTRRSDGSERVIECRCRTELDSAGVPRRLIGTFQDITDRVTATRTIEELSRRTQAILECAAEGIIGTTVAEGVVFVNPAAVALLGWPEETLLSMTDLHTLIHHTKADGTPYPHDECPLLRTIRDGRRRAVNGDVWWRQNGESFLVDFECAPLVHDDEIRGLVVTFRDVTESRRLTSQLEMANRIGSLGRVAATIAHEFNNVLMGIMPFAEVIRRRAQDNEDLLKAGDHIANSVRRGRRVTEEILRFTRPFDPVLEKIDLCEWLLQLEGELRALTSEAGVSVVVNTRDAPLRVKCDPAQLQQVVTNLTLNARDAIGQRGGEIVVTLQRHGRTAELTVRDSGPGIPPDRLEAVFEPLFTTKRSGTGLGLAVARQIVTLHGGTIEAANARGGGAVMTMTLPLADVREDIAGTLIAAPEAQA